jgi:hypothetical protein
VLRTALIKRSTLPKGELLAQKYEETNRPELGHDPRKISIYGRKSQLGMELKQGHHDLMSNDLGYDPFSQFDFLALSFFYDQNKNKIYYDRFTFVDLVSLHPYRFYDPQFSWQATVGGDRDNTLYAKGLGGMTFKPYEQSVLSLMAGVAGFADRKYKHQCRVSPTIKASFLTSIGSIGKVGIFDELSTYENQWSLEFSYFASENSEIRLIEKKKMLQFNYGYYF